MSTAPPRSAAIDRLLDAAVERQSGMFDAIRSSNDRYHRFNRSLIEGARQGSRYWAEVGKRWLLKPMDIVGVYEAISEAVGNSQARGLALSREWIEDVVESQRETREVVRQGFGDVREVVERAQASAPAFLRRTNWRRGNGQKEPAAGK